MLKGESANCRYKITRTQIVEMITSDVIFLTNFKGVIKTQKYTEPLNGTYLIQLHNESILINNDGFPVHRYLNCNCFLLYNRTWTMKNYWWRSVKFIT